MAARLSALAPLAEGMSGVAWRPGVPTQCEACLATSLEFADDGSALCLSCGTRTRPHWEQKTLGTKEPAISTSQATRSPAREHPSLPAAVPKMVNLQPPWGRRAPSTSGILGESLRILPAMPVPIALLYFGYALALEGTVFLALGNSRYSITLPQTDPGFILAAITIEALLLIVLFPYIQGAAVHSMLLRYRKNTSDVGRSLRAGFAGLPDMAGATLIVAAIFSALGVVAVFGFVLALVGSPWFALLGVVGFVLGLATLIVLGVGFSLYPAAIIATRATVLSSLFDSWRFTKGYRASLFLIYLVVGLSFGAVTILMVPGLGEMGSPAFRPLFSALVDTFFFGWISAVIAVAWDTIQAAPAWAG